MITIDGPAGVGKSTAAQLLAKRLGLVYLDTGATYRALAYAALMRRVNLHDSRRLLRLARAVRITLTQASTGMPAVVLNGRNVTREIRTEQVTDAAAIVAQYPGVRAAMVRLQRQLARTASIVIEGRDTGSVVFPQASYKFFLTADAWVRARRRQTELATLHDASPSLTTIVRQLRQRDQLDRTREVGPLRKPSDAILLDTSRLQAREVVRRMLKYLCATPSTRGKASPPCCRPSGNRARLSR